MRDKIIEHPGGRAATLTQNGADFDDAAERRFDTAIARRLKEPEQAGLMECGDRRPRQAPELLGFAGSLSQLRFLCTGALQK
jgi:hypothetical protein